jgi:L-threonylcarbamoyladenylate synthase
MRYNERMMHTLRIPVNPLAPEAEAIQRAAAILRDGGLVAFPTETVYGVGANALATEAVARVFAAKGRPGGNPLIVHVPDADAAWKLTSACPETARQLARRFWPGPLTLVLPKSDRVPDIVTAGGSTVAQRVPAHSVALALMRAAQVPLAAPSANRSSRLSPTRAEHVLRDMAGRIDLVLDGGPTPGGLESTVLDLSDEQPSLLRPGLIMMRRHYAPRTRLELAADGGEKRVRELREQGLRVGWVVYSRPPTSQDTGVVVRARCLCRHAVRRLARSG